MKALKIFIPALMLISASAFAQTEAEGTDTDFMSRTSIGIDWKLMKGLHLDAGYEMRTADSFSRIERHQASIGVQYSPVKHLDIGAGYYYIGRYNSDKEFKPRHRFYFDVMGSYKFGQWKVSLRERVQLTHNAYEFNQYQQTPNLVELKSRLKVAYKGFIHLEPYAYVELRNCFNGPSIEGYYSETESRWTSFEFLGYSDTYVNRLRAALGAQWNFDKHHGIDLRLMNDWCRNKDIDTNTRGTKLRTYCWEKAINTSLCLGYTFSF